MLLGVSKWIMKTWLWVVCMSLCPIFSALFSSAPQPLWTKQLCSTTDFCPDVPTWETAGCGLDSPKPWAKLKLSSIKLWVSGECLATGKLTNILSFHMSIYICISQSLTVCMGVNIFNFYSVLYLLNICYLTVSLKWHFWLKAIIYTVTASFCFCSSLPFPITSLFAFLKKLVELCCLLCFVFWESISLCHSDWL